MAAEDDKGTGVTVETTSEHKNGSNGANGHLPVSAKAATRSGTQPSVDEDSVERSLEDFIARANSTFLEVDGWDLESERVEAEKRAAEKRAAEQALKAEAARADNASKKLKETETEVVRLRAALAQTGSNPQVKSGGATEKTAVVSALAPVVAPAAPKKSIVPMVIGAAVIGALAMFAGVKLASSGDDSSAPAAGVAPPVPAVVQPVAVPSAPEPAAVPTEAAIEPAAVEPAAVEPVAVEPVAVEPAVVEPAVVEPVAAVAPTPVAPKPEPRKAAAPAPAKKAAKAAITDPFGAPAAAKAPAAKPAPKKKKAVEAPKGDIVDPFAM